MITRVVALALLAIGLVAVPASPSTAADTTVTVADMRFSPATVTVALGDSVVWSFQDSVAHTSTSNQGFWNSGPKSSGESFSRSFVSAGTFAYRCSIHPMMHGSVKVPVARTGSAAGGWTLRWSTVSGDGSTYDVQVRKSGAKAWKLLKNDTSAATASFKKKGTWSVRARTMQGSATSGWSPAAKVTTS